jgi:hypothetical protein
LLLQKLFIACCQLPTVPWLPAGAYLGRI